MFSLSTNAKTGIIIGAAIVIALLYAVCGAKEGFSSCYRKKMVYLRSSDSKDGGYAQFEWRQGRLNVTMQAYLPLSEAGVFTTLDGHYRVQMEGGGKEAIDLGRMVRGAYRAYYLSDALVGDYDTYEHISVYLCTKGYPDRKVLTGDL